MSKERISKRKLQAADTKRKIFEAANRLIREHGIDHVSVDSIVEAAGVSKGSFYVHYESKDALIVDLVNEHTDRADKEYSSFFISISDNKCFFDILVLLAERIADYIENNIGLENMRVLYKSHLMKGIDTSTAMNYSRELYEIVTKTLEMGLKDGELREDIPVEALAKHLILAIRGVVFEWCIRYPDFDFKQQLIDHFNILLYGLKN
jgi:AcrR family transcriptional regulator